jgi:hypothetical protein
MPPHPRNLRGVCVVDERRLAAWSLPATVGFPSELKERIAEAVSAG